MLWGLFGNTTRSTIGSILALVIGFGGGWWFSGIHAGYLSGKATVLVYNATGYPLESLMLVMPDNSTHPLCERLDINGWHWDRVPRSGSGPLKIRFSLNGEPTGAREAEVRGSMVGRGKVYDDGISLVLDDTGFHAVQANAQTFRDARAREVREEWRQSIRERFSRKPAAPQGPSPHTVP